MVAPACGGVVRVCLGRETGRWGRSIGGSRESGCCQQKSVRRGQGRHAARLPMAAAADEPDWDVPIDVKGLSGYT